MANPEHVAKLKEGVEAWNKWREENLDFDLDFREADLRVTNLSGAPHLSGAYLSGAYLTWANLYSAFLSEADLNRADLSRADLRGQTSLPRLLSGLTSKEPI